MERNSPWNRIGAAETACAVIVYETPSTRRQTEQVWREVESRPSPEPPDVSWWSFGLLQNSREAGKAAEQAARADLILFAVEFEDDLPDHVKRWIEAWLFRRGDREGALVGLIFGQRDPFAMASPKEVFLRHTAVRAGMDYLSHTPPTPLRAIPDSLDSFCDRAGRTSAVLDEILHAPMTPPPAPWV